MLSLIYAVDCHNGMKSKRMYTKPKDEFVGGYTCFISSINTTQLIWNSKVTKIGV